MTTTHSREGKTELGSHEYEIAQDITACRMGNAQWTIFRKQNGRFVDTGIDCRSLADARRYARERNWPMPKGC